MSLSRPLPPRSVNSLPAMSGKRRNGSLRPTLTRRQLLLGGGAALAASRAGAAQTPVPVPRIPLLRIAVGRLPDDLDPTNTVLPDHLWLDTLTLDAPYRWTPDGSVVPAVTTRVSVPDRDDAIDLVVRPGALLHNGRPVLADDVRYTLERIRNGSGDQLHAWRLEHVDAVQSVDTRTVRLILARPDAALMASLAHQAMGILPAGTRPADIDGGSGPFVLDALGPGLIAYARNPYFWQIARPRIDRLQVTAIEDDARRATAIAQGEIDVLPNVPLLDIPMLRDDPTVTLAGGPSNRVCHLQLNLEAPVLADARLRRLLSRAIDRARLVDVATAGQGTPTGLLFPEGSWVRDPVDDVEPLDPGAIREELRALGIPSDLRLRLVTDDADATLANTAIVLQEQLAACGIALSVDLLEDGALEDAIRQRDFDLLAAYAEPWRDPHELVRPLLASDGIRNHSGFADDRVDVLIRGAILREDRAFRRARYTLIEKAIQWAAPLIVLFHPHAYDAVATRLGAYTAYPPYTSRGLLALQPEPATSA